MWAMGILTTVYCGPKGSMSQPHRLKDKGIMWFLSIPTLCGYTNWVVVWMHPKKSKPISLWKKKLPIIAAKGSVKFFFNVFGPVSGFISPSAIRPIWSKLKRPHLFRQLSKACTQLGIKALPPILSVDTKISLKSLIMSQGSWWVLANSIKNSQNFKRLVRLGEA